jgi:hypothetical protein
MPDFPPDFAGWADAGTGAPAAALPPDFAGWVPDAPRSTKSDEERRRQAEKIGLFDDDLLNHAQGLPTKGEDGPPQPEVVKSAQQELAARKKKFDDWEAPPTMVDSGIRGARQGATFNFGDELAAISAASPIPGKNPDVPDVSFGPDLIAGGARLLGEKIAPSIFGTGGGEAYDETKARERARNEEAQRVNPGSYLTGEFGGALATLPVTPMITPFRAAEGAGIAARVMPPAPAISPPLVQPTERLQEPVAPMAILSIARLVQAREQRSALLSRPPLAVRCIQLAQPLVLLAITSRRLAILPVLLKRWPPRGSEHPA